MVATNQRDYATAISHMDMAGSHDKSSCRSATINNNIWTAGWRDGCRDSPSLNSVTRSPAPAIGASCYLAARPPAPPLPSPPRPASPILLRAMRAVPCAIINRSASDATRGTRGREFRAGPRRGDLAGTRERRVAVSRVSRHSRMIDSCRYPSPIRELASSCHATQRWQIAQRASSVTQRPRL